MTSVVGMTGLNRPSPIKLFSKNHPDQWMWQGDLSERPALLRNFEDLWVEPIRTADDNADVRTLHLPLVKALSNHLGADRFTRNIQRDNVILVSELRPDRQNSLGTT